MTKSDERITILIVDDHALFREGLREILGAQEDMAVVGEAGTGHQAITLVAQERPNVVLLDVEIPGEDVTTTVGKISELSPDTAVIILSMYDGPQVVQSLLAAGVRGYLLKSVPRQELVSAIRSSREEDGRIVLAVSRESLAGIQEAHGRASCVCQRTKMRPDPARAWPTTAAGVPVAVISATASAALAAEAPNNRPPDV